MEKHISIQIPKPCHEDWAAMTPDDKGRFCNSCSKIVVDFTLMSNTEIIRYFETASQGSTCGRFSGSQVDTPLYPEPVIVIPPYRYAWLTPFRKLAAMLVTGMTLFLASCNRKPGTTTGEIAAPPTVQPARPDTAKTNTADTSKQYTPPDRDIKMGEVPQRPEKMGKICIPREPEVLQGEVAYPETLTGDTIAVQQP